MTSVETTDPNFKPNMRQSKLLEMILSQGFAETEAAAKTFEKTTQTIRRDFEILEKQGLIRRVHGGASTPLRVTDRPYSQRLASKSHEKDMIGRAAAQLIENNRCVFLSLGTSAEAVARYLTDHTGMLFVTNNFNVAMTLRNVKDSDLILSGGHVREQDGGMLDPHARGLIKDYRFDYSIIGAGAITESGELYTNHLDEAHITQTIINNSQSTILVADEKKTRQRANHRMTHLENIDILVTEKQVSGPLAELCKAQNVKLIKALEDS